MQHIHVSDYPLYSLASHTLCRGREGLVTLQLLSCHRGTQLSLCNKMLTSTKHVTYLYSMTTDVIYEGRRSDWSHQVSVLATTQWLQCDQTLPFSEKSLACETTPSRGSIQLMSYMYIPQTEQCSPSGECS